MNRTLLCIGKAMTCLGAILVCHGCASGPEQGGWKVLREDNYRNRFAYDTASVKRTPSGTITVWAESTGAKYLYELDCENKRQRLLQGPGAAPDQWGAIIGNSADQLLYDEVCQTR